MSTLESGVRALLNLPRGQQVLAARLLLDALPEPEVREEWNSAFGPQSLYEAWSQTSVASACLLYTSDAADE